MSYSVSPTEEAYKFLLWSLRRGWTEPFVTSDSLASVNELSLFSTAIFGAMLAITFLGTLFLFECTFALVLAKMRHSSTALTPFWHRQMRMRVCNVYACA